MQCLICGKKMFVHNCDSKIIRNANPGQDPGLAAKGIDVEMLLVCMNCDMPHELHISGLDSHAVLKVDKSAVINTPVDFHEKSTGIETKCGMFSEKCPECEHFEHNGATVETATAFACHSPKWKWSLEENEQFKQESMGKEVAVRSDLPEFDVSKHCDFKKQNDTP